MGNPEHLKILKKGVPTWNEWRLKNPYLCPDLSGANLRQRQFVRTEYTGINFQRTNLQGSNLEGAVLAYANLREARLDNAKSSEAIFAQADLFVANLSGAELVNASFTDTNLYGANFRAAKLDGAEFQDINLDHADFSGAELRYAYLSDAHLIGGFLTRADLSGAVLQHVILIARDIAGAKFHNAYMDHVTFGDMDLSGAEGLENVMHGGASTIGLDTLYKSQGKISDEFLLNAGVPKEVIEALLPSIRCGPPIQWESCFISYSTKDEEFARRLHDRMRQANMVAYYAPRDLRGGKKLHDQLFEAIQIHDRLLLVLSRDSIQSEWVTTEILKAREFEKKQNRRKLFPIRLVDFGMLRDWTCFDADTGKDLAKELRKYFIPDFSNWKNHDAFEEAFAGLQRDLKAEENRAGK